MLLNFFVSSLKRTIPEKWWKTYLVVGGEWSEIDVSAGNIDGTLADWPDQPSARHREQDSGICLLSGSKPED
jgi:hypothetical protein